MAIVNIGEILNRVVAYEDRLEKYYAVLRDQTRDNGVKLLAYYLSRHRRRLGRWLDLLDARQLEHLRMIELRFDVEFHPGKQFKAIDIPPTEIKGPELLESAVAYDTALIALYQRILEQPLNDEARTQFESLVSVEEQDVVMLKKMIAMDYF